MGEARHAEIEANQDSDSPHPAEPRLTSRHLETVLCSGEDRRRIVGIGNGLVLGAAIWAIVLTAIAIVV